MSRKPKKTNRKHTGAIIVLILMMLIFIAGSGLMIKLCLDLANEEFTIQSNGDSSITLPTAPETEATAKFAKILEPFVEAVTIRNP